MSYSALAGDFTSPITALRATSAGAELVVGVTDMHVDTVAGISTIQIQCCTDPVNGEN